MRKNNYSKYILGLLLTGSILFGCGKSEPITCPYTDLNWETTKETLFEQKGDYVNSYGSIYGGTTYEYDGSYMEKNGRIKYMFDDNEMLVNVAFTYSSDDSNELSELYEKIYSGIEKEYGKSGYHTDEPNNYGDTWEMKEGKILLSVMDTDSLKVLQVAYVNPEEK